MAHRDGGLHDLAPVRHPLREPEAGHVLRRDLARLAHEADSGEGQQRVGEEPVADVGALRPPGDALDRFEAAWNRAAEGRRAPTLAVLTLPDLPALLKNLTPARWQLLARLRAQGPLSVYELARRLERDYKNVHTDVKRLAELGLVERRADARVAVGWDTVRCELSLAD